MPDKPGRVAASVDGKTVAGSRSVMGMDPGVSHLASAGGVERFQEAIRV